MQFSLNRTGWLLAIVCTFLVNPTVVQCAPRDKDRLWEQVATHEPPPSMGLRSLFGYMLSLGESRSHPERMDQLFDLAVAAQNHDPKHRHYGNLKWTWRDEGVTDTNAVEFCMQDAAVLWIKHRDWLPESAREKLRQILLLSIEGCLRHRVSVSYTNIAILNAANLIVLGEQLGQPAAAAEGYARLKDICQWTWAYGTHEFCSPTYFGVDLGGLNFLRTYTQREEGRQRASALLQLFWTDVAANWFEPTGRMAGANSRTYDYLRGLGHLDLQLQAAGWIKGPGEAENIVSARAIPPWPVPEKVQAIRTQFPRWVRQSWGISPCQSRTQQLYADVTLSTAGESYGSQDALLCADLPGDRKLARCYFIPDGREDPYGQNRYAADAAKHLKALHLTPFWAAAQQGPDAVTLAIYRSADLKAKEVKNLQSHFVFRRDLDRQWSDEHKTLILRSGTAAVGIRVLWSRAQDGQPANIHLVDDGQPEALRLTVEHHCEQATDLAGVALWVRVGSGLNTDEAFNAWRKQFDSVRPIVKIGDRTLQFAVPGEEGPVSVQASAPFTEGCDVQLTPAMSSLGRPVLEMNGKELGRPLLEALETPATLQAWRTALQPIMVPDRGSIAWEAESGFVFRPMIVGDDADASGGRYVSSTADKGTVTWALHVTQANTYYLWARVLAPDSQHDSFRVGLIGDGYQMPGKDWNLTRAPHWQWQVLRLDKSKTPTPLSLTAGICQLQLRVREVGTKIDRLFLTSDPQEKPR